MRRTPTISVLAVLALALIAPSLARAQAPAGLAGALAWMRAEQQADGSFPGFGPGDTADAVIALVAAGEDLADFAKGGSTPVSYLEAQAAGYATNPGAAAKLAMAAIAAGADPASFGGLDLFAVIGKGYDPATGQYGPDVYGHALALLAIKAAGATPPDAAVARLLAAQLPDGGWSFDGTEATGSDTNTTGLALQALAGRAGPVNQARANALTYLESQQNDDGGFPYSQASSFGTDSDVNSTAAAALGIRAAGGSPGDPRWQKNGNGPVELIESLQNDSGAFRYQQAQADDNALATYQAVPALAGATLPVATAQVAGAQAAVAGGSSAQAAGLPATAEGRGAPLGLIALLSLALVACGARLRRAVA